MINNLESERNVDGGRPIKLIALIFSIVLIFFGLFLANTTLLTPQCQELTPTEIKDAVTAIRESFNTVIARIGDNDDAQLGSIGINGSKVT